MRAACQTGGVITLAATPIGNVDDASERLRELLAGADVIAAEDTRKLRDLLRRLAITPVAQILTYHEHNEASRTQELLDLAREGKAVLVVSDAGMPGISDPGYRLVTEAAAQGVPVTVAPGPSAVLAALALSGLPTDRFCFEGFLPRKTGARAAALASLAQEPRTMVFFEAPHRVAAALEAMAEALGADRPAAMCRELTKTYEEVTRGTLADLIARADQGVKGEIVVVVAGKEESAPEVADLVSLVQKRIAAGERMKEAVTDVAAEAGVRRRGLYEAVLDAERDC